MKRASLYVAGATATYPVRVEVLAVGPKRARVRLLHKAKVPPAPGRWLKRGDTIYVPSDALFYANAAKLVDIVADAIDEARRGASN
jgi:hypothetical protein